jgi:hypothetical protein
VRKLALLLASTAGLFVMGSSAIAEDPAQPAPAAAAAAPAAAPAEDPNKIVCHNMNAPTGTRLGVRRECKTQKEWDDARLQTQHEVTNMETRNNFGPRSN